MSSPATQTLTPRLRYQRDLGRPGFQADPAQALAVEKLQALYDTLVERWHADRRVTARISRSLGGRAPVTGLYFWGGVGRGKTWLMDIFFESLPFRRKMRSHFHRFMQRVHAELRTLSGEKNPLDIVADRFAREALVICFDEFFVSDITDAMILGSLFEKLFERGVTLVATSNIVPDDLYKDGLQRERFLPAIAVLKKHVEVVNVDSGIDYRLRVLEKAEIFHHPLGEAAERSLEQSFRELARGMSERADEGYIEINDRQVLVRHIADDIVWFDFDEMCVRPRSASDYIEIARQFHAVLLSGVPQMDAASDDAARRFINMVDEFYDRNVKLIVSAAEAVESLYAGGRLAFEFARTRSRLLEMQSHEYLARPHKP
ncbi:MAG: cell division protein ZapE [Pseudomonadota bacterium]